MEQIILGIPNPKQVRFLEAKSRYVAFGGARGGGKSWVVRNKAVRLCLRYPGIRILIVRRTYPELTVNHIEPLRKLLGAVAKYDGTEKIFHFSGGSTLRFGYCSREQDLLRYQGAEFDVIFIDEATQLQEMWLKTLNACVRGVNGFPKRVYYTCNPGGVSHGYFKRLFVDRQFEAGEDPADYTFIQSLVTDNTALLASQPEYLRQLDALPPKLRGAWRYGLWDQFEGQFFDEFRSAPDTAKCELAGITPEQARQQHRFTHVIDPIPAGRMATWNFFRSYDFGYQRPFSVGYWAMDDDGVLYRVAEFYGWNGNPDQGVRWSPEEQFQRLRAFEEDHPLLRGRRFTDSVADPSIWDKSRGESIAETAMRYGIYFTPGDNHRIPGWMQLHARLQFDEDGYARLYCFDTCHTFIRTMPLMQFAAVSSEDLDTTLEDHCMDETRYLCMARPLRPARETALPVFQPASPF